MTIMLEEGAFWVNWLRRIPWFWILEIGILKCKNIFKVKPGKSMEVLNLKISCNIRQKNCVSYKMHKNWSSHCSVEMFMLFLWFIYNFTFIEREFSKNFHRLFVHLSDQIDFELGMPSKNKIAEKESLVHTGGRWVKKIPFF